MPSRDLARLQLLPRHLAMLQALLAEHAPHAEVWAYGSRVSGGAHECSDLDIVLRTPADLNAASPVWMDLREALQASALPILVDAHDWALLPESFHRNIEGDYVVMQHAQAGQGD